MPAPRGPLRHADFRWLLLGQMVSAAGDRFALVGIAALVVQSGHGVSGLGLVLGGRSLAMLMFILVAGVIGDRFSRIRVMIAADTSRIVALLALALVPGDASIFVLAGLTFFAGAGEAFFQPAYRALLPSVLPPADLAAGNALTALTRQIASILGPAVAGPLVVVFGARTALLIDAGTFAVSVGTLALLREPVRASRSTVASFRREVTEGFGAVIDRPWIGLGILMATSHLIFALAPWLVLLPVIAIESLGGTDVYGALLALAGAGSVVGALIAGRQRPRLPGVIALVALIPSGVMLLMLAGPAPLALLGLIVFLSGVGETVFEVHWTTGIQRDVPPHLLARVFSVDYAGSLVLMPLGYILVGPAADTFGRDTILIFGAVVVFATTIPLLLIPSMRRFASAPASSPTQGDGRD